MVNERKQYKVGKANEARKCGVKEKEQERQNEWQWKRQQVEGLKKSEPFGNFFQNTNKK